ncbi:MAG: DUF308 domain-containing protein [Methyloceanibacter sp.]
MSASDAARYDALSEVLAESWWAVGLRGLLGIAFGLICLLVPAAAILSLVLLFSAYMLVDGVFAIISGLKPPAMASAGACSSSKAWSTSLRGRSPFSGPPSPPSPSFSSSPSGRSSPAG